MQFFALYQETKNWFEKRVKSNDDWKHTGAQPGFY